MHIGREREEYNKGTYNQELETVEAEIAVSRENLKRAEEYLKFSNQLSAKSFITRTQLQADEFSVTKATIELNLALQKRDVLIGFTKSRTEEQLKAEVKLADRILIATDPDREGEAIAWHVKEYLEEKIKKPYFTDTKYFFKALYNIFIRNKRSA